MAEGKIVEIQLSSMEVVRPIAAIGEQLIEQPGAEIARLREALEGVQIIFAPDQKGRFAMLTTSLCERGYQECTAALITPADDWLERHDAEVREQERERIVADSRAYNERCVASKEAE